MLQGFGFFRLVFVICSKNKTQEKETATRWKWGAGDWMAKVSYLKKVIVAGGPSTARMDSIPSHAAYKRSVGAGGALS